MKNWTIGIVNYKSINYIEYQLKILYELNNPKDFDLIIIDNSEPTEINFLKKLSSKYQDEFKNISLIVNENFNDNFKLRTSSQHAEGLNLILQQANSKFLLVQDPDFFWIKKDYLNILGSEIESGSLVVGAPYGVSIKTGKPDFPSSFGCAYNLIEIKQDQLNFDAGTYEEKISQHKYPGWKMREKYSQKKYVSFDQYISFLPFLFGDHSYLSIPRYYKYKNEIIGYHLFRGSFVADSKQHVENAQSIEASKKIKDSRYLYSKYFYLMSKNRNIYILKDIKFIDILINFFKLLKRKKVEDSINPYHYKELKKNFNKKINLI
jgi:hypothetical protein